MQIIEDRRQLHRIPELELCLPKTMAYLQNSLSKLNCRLFSPIESSLCAFFDFGKEDAIAFRADCDALPILENNDISYVSTHEGNMHACGHDGHMSILLELARRLNCKTELPHNVLLIFQPGEENPGGAQLLCDTGFLKEYAVKAIFGLHLWPGLEKGKVFSKENALMSHSSEVNVDIYGKSAHIGKAWEGIDALAAAVAYYSAVTAYEASLPADVLRVLKFGHLRSGTVRNALSDHSRLEGSLRAYEDEVFNDLLEHLYSAAKQVEADFGCKVNVDFANGYPAVMNPPELCRRVEKVAAFQHLEAPFMPSEDFSCYQQYVPGMFFFLGIGDTPALHANNFNFDEEILVKGADFFEKLAEKFL